MFQSLHCSRFEPHLVQLRGATDTEERVVRNAVSGHSLVACVNARATLLELRLIMSSTRSFKLRLTPDEVKDFGFVAALTFVDFVLSAFSGESDTLSTDVRFGENTAFVQVTGFNGPLPLQFSLFFCRILEGVAESSSDSYVSVESDHSARDAMQLMFDVRRQHLSALISMLDISGAFNERMLTASDATPRMENLIVVTSWLHECELMAAEPLLEEMLHFAADCLLFSEWVKAGVTYPIGFDISEERTTATKKNFDMCQILTQPAIEGGKCTVRFKLKTFDADDMFYIGFTDSVSKSVGECISMCPHGCAHIGNSTVQLSRDPTSAWRGEVQVGDIWELTVDLTRNEVTFQLPNIEFTCQWTPKSTPVWAGFCGILAKSSVTIV